MHTRSVTIDSAPPGDCRSSRQVKKCQRAQRSVTHFFPFHKSDMSLSICTKRLCTLRDCLENDRRPGFVIHEMLPLFKYGRTSKFAAEESFHSLKYFHLSHDATKIRDEPNAGGSSVVSEVLSFEILHRMFCAKLEHTEMDITYFPIGSKKTDYAVSIGGTKYGVSVTRAMHFMGDENFTEMDAMYILNKKLTGILFSTQNVIKRQKWSKQILHVFVRNRKIANMLSEQYKKMPKELKSNTIVFVTVAEDANYVFI